MRILILMLLALLFLTKPATSAPAYNSDAVSFTDTAPGTGTITHGFTQGSGSGNLMLIVVLGYEASVVWSVSYNGVGMTRLRETVNSAAVTSIFYLSAPATGTNNVTYSAPAGYYTSPVSAMIFSYSGTNGIGSANDNVASPSGSPFPTSITLTPSTSTSTIFGVGHLSAGGCGGASWTLSTNLGTSRYVFYAAHNNPKGIGFVDYAPGSTSNFSQTLTFTASCYSGSVMAGMLTEILASGAAPASDGTHRRRRGRS